jgi:hypothetical protein
MTTITLNPCETVDDVAPAAECGCPDLEAHVWDCSWNPDPFVCEWCDELANPDDVDRPDACEADHCHDCARDCPRCTNPRNY